MGSENKDLPSFVVLVSTPNTPPTAVHLYGAAVSCPPCIKGFNSLPGRAGVISEQPRRNEVRRSAQSLDTLQALNKLHLDAVGDPEILTRIQQFEMAYKMQSSVPNIMDISKETKETLALYGAARPAILREQLPARTSSGGIGSSFCPALPLGLGSTRHQPGRRYSPRLGRALQGNRSRQRGFDQRSEAQGLLDSTLIIWAASSVERR